MRQELASRRIPAQTKQTCMISMSQVLVIILRMIYIQGAYQYSINTYVLNGKHSNQTISFNDFQFITTSFTLFLYICFMQHCNLFPQSLS